MRPARLAAVAALASIAAASSSCVSLFPKQTPAQLYRFGEAETAPATPRAPASEPRFAVLPLPIGFDRAAAGDAILTMTGDQAAYIKGARWVISAQALFDAAVIRAFDADRGAARLMTRGEITKPDATLKLDVRTFEARYDRGQAAAPTVVVEVHGVLTPMSQADGPPRERLFTVRRDAADNRVAPITTAFDEATGQALGEIVAWVDARGAT